MNDVKGAVASSRMVEEIVYPMRMGDQYAQIRWCCVLVGLNDVFEFIVQDAYALLYVANIVAAA